MSSKPLKLFAAGAAAVGVGCATGALRGLSVSRRSLRLAMISGKRRGAVACFMISLAVNSSAARKAVTALACQPVSSVS